MIGHYSRNGFLTAKGLEEAAQRYLEFPGGVDMEGTRQYLDVGGSVSGARRDESLYVHDDEYLDSQYRRFLDEVVLPA